MQVTVLGKSPSWQDTGGACSGYLIREGEFTLLLDCGSGVFPKLRANVDYVDVDAILISHLHPDHFLDLVPFSFALAYSPRHPAARPELHVPPGAREFFRDLGATWNEPGQFERAFRVEEYDPAASLTVGPISVRFCEVPHYTRSFANELTGPDGRRFTFGADCGPSEALVSFADGTDLLMLEATEANPNGSEPRGHMAAREAGELARRAQASRLVVTHFSDELDPTHVRTEAEAGFGSEVALAHEGAQYTV